MRNKYRNRSGCCAGLFNDGKGKNDTLDFESLCSEMFWIQVDTDVQKEENYFKRIKMKEFVLNMKLLIMSSKKKKEFEHWFFCQFKDYRK